MIFHDISIYPQINLYAAWGYSHSMQLIQEWMNIYKIPLWYWPSFRGQSRTSATNALTHWGRVTHICVGKLTIIGSDNGLSPERRQAIIWTNAGILLIGPLGTNFNEISIEIQTFSLKESHLKMSSVKWRPLCLSLNVFIHPELAVSEAQ